MPKFLQDLSLDMLISVMLIKKNVYFATLYKLIIICKIKYFKTAKNKTFRTFHKKIQKSTKKVQKMHHKGKISVSNFVF